METSRTEIGTAVMTRALAAGSRNNIHTRWHWDGLYVPSSSGIQIGILYEYIIVGSWPSVASFSDSFSAQAVTSAFVTAMCDVAGQIRC